MQSQKWWKNVFAFTGLTRFFHNGENIRKDAIYLIISKIQSILRWFESQTRLHFYASSLLLIYEGSPHGFNGTKHMRVKSQCNHGSSYRTHSQPYWTDLPHDIQSERNINGGSVKEDSLEEQVDVKMIDFAHVFPSDGPDESYMYGLRNLLGNLEHILKDWRQWESLSLRSDIVCDQLDSSHNTF